MDATRLWAEIDLSAVAFNLRQVRSCTGADVDILCPVKADAYGHGAVEVSRELVRCGITMLGVANVSEGIELREAKIRTPILVLGATLPGEVPAAIRQHITLTVSPPDILPVIAAEAARQGRPTMVHLMVDTGMTRMGVETSKVAELARQVMQTPSVALEGLATHFPLTDDSDWDYSREQLSVLNDMLESLAREDIHPPIRHAANTSGTVLLDDSHLTMVRPGLSLYGMYSSAAVARRIEFRPVLCLKTQIVYLRDVTAGTPVGYGHSWTAPEDTRIATLAIGYADGYSRLYSNRADVIHRGRRAPVVGRVSMDCITVDLGREAEAAIGDTVTLIGREGDASITAEEMAEWRDSIPHEVTCSLGTRVKRIYVRNGANPPAGRAGRSVEV